MGKTWVAPVGAAFGEFAHEAAGGVVVHVALPLLVVGLGLDIVGNAGQVGHGGDLLCETLTWKAQNCYSPNTQCQSQARKYGRGSLLL